MEKSKYDFVIEMIKKVISNEKRCLIGCVFSICFYILVWSALVGIIYVIAFTRGIAKIWLYGLVSYLVILAGLLCVKYIRREIIYISAHRSIIGEFREILAYESIFCKDEGIWYRFILSDYLSKIVAEEKTGIILKFNSDDNTQPSVWTGNIYADSSISSIWLGLCRTCFETYPRINSLHIS